MAGVGSVKVPGPCLHRHACPHVFPCRAACNPRIAFRLQRRHPISRRQATAALDVQAEPSQASMESTSDDFRRLLTGKGWDRAWIDGIVRSIQKSEQKTNVEECGRVLKLLEDLGIPTQSVCNMAAIAPNLACRKAAEVEGVVSNLQAHGIDGELLATTLERHPRLLAYDAPASGSGPLCCGAARASVALVDARGGKAVSVSLWREGAAFLTSPVSPWRPADA